MINEQLANKRQNTDQKLIIINKLFKKLLNIYKYKFPKELLLYHLTDFAKLKLFKQVILELIINHVHIKNSWASLKQQIKSIDSTCKIIPLLKQYILNILLSINTITTKDKRRLIFYVNQWLTNFTKQQPQLIWLLFNDQNIIEIEQNFLIGIKNFLAELIKNNGYCDIKTKAQNIFIFGENIATTKNNIIYKNNIMQLIKYVPNNIKYQVPILFISPCTNKYYILDLSTKKSLIKWLTEQGFIVYIIDWLNPSFSEIDNNFKDYIINGSVLAIKMISVLQNTKNIHLAGYCMGGAILSCTLSYVQQLNIANILSATYLMAPVDLAGFKTLHKESLDKLSKAIDKIGYLDGKLLCTAFHLIHTNELIWPYFINHYLLNKPINDFAALYWYSDPINLPANMYNFYMQEICFKNNLRYANKIIINNIKIDLTTINTPIFSVAGEYDPISDWQLVYNSMTIYNKSKNKQFILVRGGHVSSLLASPKDKHNSYKINNTNTINQDASSWYNNAIEIQDSWWNCWKEWLQKLN